nr:integrating conjugative element protein [Thioalkalivibrio sp. ALE28]
MPIRKSLIAAATCVALAGPGTAQALVPSEDGIWYYEVGGAEPISNAPNPTVTTTRLAFGAEASAGYSCGSFDPLLSIENTLNEVAQGMEDMVDQMVQAATNAIASLPAMVLQRSNPGLYDLFQNNLLRAEEELSLATQSCEEMEAAIADGRNPYQEWVTLSKGDDWRAAMGSGGDIVQVQEEIDQNAGNDGAEWIGGRRGGQGQEPIDVISDTVKAGYNITLDRPPNAGTPYVGSGDPPLLARTWNTPQEAQEWATRVLGDKHIRTCQGCSSETTPGVGLLPILEETNQQVREDLMQLVSGATNPTRSNLRDVSAPGVGVSRGLIEALRELPESDRMVATGRLAQEVATARTMEQALLTRRMLLSGRKAPEIDAAGVAREDIRDGVEEITSEIDTLMMEIEARQAVVSNTAGSILREAQRRARASSGTPSPQPIETAPIRGGVVPQP